MPQNHESIYSKILDYLGSRSISGSNEDEIIDQVAKVLGLPFGDVSTAFGALKTHRLILREASSSLNLTNNTSRTIVRFSVAKQENENNKKTVKPDQPTNVKNYDRVDSPEVQDILSARARASFQNDFKTRRDFAIEDIIKNPRRNNYAGSGIIVNEDEVRRIRRGGQAGADRAGTW
jgi:hypothetical protein